jgi:hypothetical protein
MRPRLLSVIAAALVAVAVAIPGAASPAHASPAAGPPPGYVPPAGYQTTPPESCYVYAYTSGSALVGAATECIRTGGLHRAVALCSNGQTLYGWTEEMEYFHQSVIMCRSRGYYGDLIPALYAWGEYYLDW